MPSDGSSIGPKPVIAVTSDDEADRDHAAADQPSHVLFGLAADSGLDPALRPTNRPPMS